MPSHGQKGGEEEENAEDAEEVFEEDFDDEEEEEVLLDDKCLIAVSAPLGQSTKIRRLFLKDSFS